MVLVALEDQPDRQDLLVLEDLELPLVLQDQGILCPLKFQWTPGHPPRLGPPWGLLVLQLLMVLWVLLDLLVPLVL